MPRNTPIFPSSTRPWRASTGRQTGNDFRGHLSYNRGIRAYQETAMKIVQGEELQWQRGLEHRGGIFHNRLLMEGEPGTIDNFQLSMGRMGGAFFSPRHRHNFEQIRFQLDGELDFARDGRMKTGMVGYFPEGMFYGPQSQDPEGTPITIVLQMGGASGSGY